jgi:hypothetical protein
MNFVHKKGWKKKSRWHVNIMSVCVSIWRSLNIAREMASLLMRPSCHGTRIAAVCVCLRCNSIPRNPNAWHSSAWKMIYCLSQLHATTGSPRGCGSKGQTCRITYSKRKPSWYVVAKRGHCFHGSFKFKPRITFDMPVCLPEPAGIWVEGY